MATYKRKVNNGNILPVVVAGTLSAAGGVVPASGGGTAVALTTPPANLTAAGNTALTANATFFLAVVENKTGESKFLAFPSPASAGNYEVKDGEIRQFVAGREIPVAGTTSIGVYGASASPLNGSSAGNLILDLYQ